MLKLIALNYTVMLNSQWLNIQGKIYFIETSVVLISVMLPSIKRNMPLKKYKKYTVFMLFVHCTFED